MGARHRAARRPTTPLSAFGQVVTGTVGRRTVVAVASSGIILTLSASAGVSAPVQNVAAISASSLTAGTENLTTSPSVTVAADAAWSFASAEVSSQAPPPPPPRVVRTTTTSTVQASRGGTARTAAQATSAPAPVPSATGNAIVDIAFRYVGTPYVWGGITPAGFDCSGFTGYVYAQVGITLPRSSSAQRDAGYVVSAAEARPGDLVWWPGHIGIYLGGNQNIAARNPGTPLYAGEIYNSSPTFIRVTG